MRNIHGDWKDGSVGKVLAKQAQTPAVDLQNPQKGKMINSTKLSSDRCAI